MFLLRGRVGRYRVAALVALIAMATLAAMASSAPAAAPFARGFADDVWFDGAGNWVPRTVATGAQRVLFEVDWASIEPNAPAPGSDATNPSNPAYAFAYLDARVKAFAGSGISVAFLVTDAPSWAEAPGGPASLESVGAWRPNTTAYGQMASALAARYSGSYPDPFSPGTTLPRVRYFQAWAEPNFSVHLAPQWTRSGGRLVATGPVIYRGLLDAFYSGIKRIHTDNTVITAGFGPYGDPPSLSPTDRMPPAEFVQELLCLHGHRLSLEKCPQPARFDALAIDPYEVGSPTTRALNADDVTAPDLGKLTRAVNKAVAHRRALPRDHKQLWVTEFSYDSNPPNPTAVSLATQARWLEESFYVFWSEGVNTVFWYLLRDQAGHDYSTSYFSGVFFYNGTPKPSFEAYRFPLVVMPSGPKATVWGISPRTGTVAVQHRSGRSWRTLFRIRDSAGGVFVRHVPLRLHGAFRAAAGGETSLVWQR